MSEKKPTNVEVVKVEVKGPNLSKAQLRCMDTGDLSWHPYYRKKYKPKQGEDERTDAERLVCPGAKLRVGFQYKEGKAKNDGSGESYPSEWCIQDVETLATTTEAKEVFDTPSNPAPPRPVQQNDREKSICYQSARKDAAVMEAAYLTSMGWELWEKERGWKALKSTTEDCYRMVNDLAGHGFDIFED